MAQGSGTIRVGIFMTIGLLALGWLILRVEDWRFWRGGKGVRIEALFDSVSGLDDKAAVRLAGVRVGRVDGIRLDGRKARVSLLLEEPLALTEGTVAAIANQGLLGDKFIEIRPGPEGAPRLPPGAVLPGETPVSFDQAMEKIDKIGTSIQEFMSGAAGEGGAGGGLGKLIDSISATADEIRALITENRQSVGGTVKNFERFSATLAEELPRLTRQIQVMLEQVDAVLAENRGNLRDSMANVREVTEKIQTSVDNLNTITDKIARGEGTIGKLVNSDEAHNELMSALGSVEKGVTALGDTLGRVQELKLGIGIEGDYLSEVEDYRSSFHLDVLPHGEESSRYYRIGLVTDPRGRITEKESQVTVTLPDGSVETTTTSTVQHEKTKANWSALFGFPFAGRRGSLWAGVIENTGGVQVDWSFLDRRLGLSLEAFDFGRERDLDPHLRLTGRWALGKYFVVRAGYDDPLVDEFRSPFIGAGIRWTDDDLKYLLGSVPSF
jgi:phospholipid/cholesterol/gamma-HCH transport system substrate-binding protein